MAERAWLIATVQVVEAPEQAPLQPVKPEPAAAPAVSVTFVPTVKSAAQAAAQAMPAGLLVTVPLPAPAELTLSAYTAASSSTRLVSSIV